MVRDLALQIVKDIWHKKLVFHWCVFTAVGKVKSEVIPVLD
jgi:hypothetical protein